MQGDNSFKIPHVGKSHLKRKGRLPEQWSCDAMVAEAARALLKDEDIDFHLGVLHEEMLRCHDLVNLCSLFESVGIVDHPVCLDPDNLPDSALDDAFEIIAL